MSVRVATLVAVAAVAAAATPGTARGALFLLLSPASGVPGDRVTVRTGGTPLGFTPAARAKPLQLPIRLYLVKHSVAPRVASRFDRRLEFVGALVPDRNGRGMLTFAVPPLAPGAYGLAYWCPGCAAYSRGRTFWVQRVDRSIATRYRPLMLLRVTASAAARGCRVTVPNGPERRLGNGFLSVWLPPGGVLSRGPEPDGSIFDKLGWLPTRIDGERSVLTVHGRRLDARSRPLRVLAVNWGYSSNGRGSWASAVLFPSEGCWRVTGRVRDITLSYVIEVRRA